MDMWFINFYLKRITNSIDPDAELGYQILGRYDVEIVQNVAKDLGMEIVVH